MSKPDLEIRKAELVNRVADAIMANSQLAVDTPGTADSDVNPFRLIAEQQAIAALLAVRKFQTELSREYMKAYNPAWRKRKALGE